LKKSTSSDSLQGPATFTAGLPIDVGFDAENLKASQGLAQGYANEYIDEKQRHRLNGRTEESNGVASK